MAANFDPSPVDAVNDKLRQQASETARRELAAEPAPVAQLLTLPPEARNGDIPIEEGEFQRLLQRAGEGDLTEPEFQQVRNDLERAGRKRKQSVMAGRRAEAASASSREKTITWGFLVPYALSGVRAKPGPKKGGRVTGLKKQAQGHATRVKVHELATHLLRDHAPREVSGIICTRLGLRRPTALKHLRDHPSGHWSRKREVSSA
jgi:hypothetical protein